MSTDHSLSNISLEDILKDLNDLPEDIGNDLPEDFDAIKLRIEQSGYENAAKYYGAVFYSYDCHKLAARLSYVALLTKLGGSDLDLYLERVGKILRPEIIDYIVSHKEVFQNFVNIAENNFFFKFDWLQIMTHTSVYLLKGSYTGSPIETPAQMHLRVIAELFHHKEHDKPTLSEALECYTLLTSQEFTFASPVFFNSGLKHFNLLSCFLMHVPDRLDVPEDGSTQNSIMNVIRKIGAASKNAGGVGLDLSAVRHSSIGHAGMSQGIIPLVQVFDVVVRYVDQTGKRNGAATATLQIHHIDIVEFVDGVRKNADEQNRFRMINTAIVIPDIFWERVRGAEGGKWTIFCPGVFPGLNETFDDEYRKLYLKYETMEVSPEKAIYRKTIKAKDLIEHIAKVQIGAGMPYILHKDSINLMSNQVNLRSYDKLHHRCIRTSNLCQEIMEQCDDEEVACCNLGQLSLKAFANIPLEPYPEKGFESPEDEENWMQTCINYDRLGFITRMTVSYLNKVIDRNQYVIADALRSNMRHRPIGLGVSGYSDLLDRLHVAYESSTASELNRRIFACIYYNALASSVSLASEEGAYRHFAGSPLSEGTLMFEMWYDRMAKLAKLNEATGGSKIPEEQMPIQPDQWRQKPIYYQGIEVEGESAKLIIINPGWEELKRHIIMQGVRNSQLIAIMPCASSARMLSNAENTEAHQSCIYIRNFMKNSAVVMNTTMYYEMRKAGIWSRDIAEFIVSQGGSVSRIGEFLELTASTPKEREIVTEQKSLISSISRRYKTMFEIKQKTVFRQIADRHRYVCQGISANVYLGNPTIAMMKNFHEFTHDLGLKTGMYYLREPPPSAAPEYSRCSAKVRLFLSGKPMPTPSVDDTKHSDVQVIDAIESPVCMMRVGDKGACLMCN